MFDPYHKWLGIPPGEQPPNHYRLLGIAAFEADPEVIDAAANRQMAYLQTCASGPQVLLSQRLLNEVAAARLCLLVPATKAVYDERLRRQLGRAARRPAGSLAEPARRPAPPPAPAAPATLEALTDLSIYEVSTGPLPRAKRHERPGRGRRSPRRSRLAWPLILLATLSLALFLRDPRPEPTPDPADEAPAAGPREPRPDVWTPPVLAAYDDEAFRPLFRGRTIAGPLYNMSPCTDEGDYRDYVLRFEYRLKTPGHQPWNGVRLRHGGPRLSLVLCRGLSGALLFERPVENLKKPFLQEKIDGLHWVSRPARDADRGLGEWNECQVICEGPRTIVSINGQVVNDIPNCPEGQGMVCLSGYEEEVAFRSIRILEIGKARPGRDAAVVAAPAPKPQTSTRFPGLLQSRIRDWHGSTTDFAAFHEMRASVGMGPESDFGIGEVGLEIQGIQRFRMDVEMRGDFRKVDADTVAGLVVDYHTWMGYSKRVVLDLGPSVTGRIAENPSWGAARAPDLRYPLTGKSPFEINLARWAPALWDDRAWVTVIVQNTGKNTAMNVMFSESRPEPGPAGR